LPSRLRKLEAYATRFFHSLGAKRGWGFQPQQIDLLRLEAPATWFFHNLGANYG
jgi:hypothetical protein